ncbi:MAG: MBL fold metallo-hydrolase [Halobacteriota archaeon]|nr:MBL fold metallo-hydrolase [Halobacteriota archaeon]
MKKVSENIYVETGFQGCNPGFVTTSEGVVMIDTPQKSSDAAIFKEEIESRGEVRFIINTEYHLDHVSSNHLFPGTIVSHQGTRDALKGQKFRLPEITFSHKMCLYSGEHTFELMHLPGHTPSEIAVYIPQEKVLFTGDNIFYQVQTFLQEALPFKWLESLEKMSEINADILIPGHGEVCDRSYIKEQAALISEWIDAIRKAIDDGLSEKEAAGKLSSIDHYPMDVGIEGFRKALQRMNVGRLYRVLKEDGKEKTDHP